MTRTRASSRINVTHPMRNIRQSLGIDTWGMDIFRLKRRLGQQQMMIESLDRRVSALEENAILEDDSLDALAPEPSLE